MTSQNDSGCDESYDAYKRVSAEFRDRPKNVDVNEPANEQYGYLNVEQINGIVEGYNCRAKTQPTSSGHVKKSNFVKLEQENRSDMTQLLAEMNQEYQVLQETSINWAIRYTHRVVTIEHLIKKLQDIRNGLRRIEKTRAQLHADLTGCGLDM